MKKLFRPLESLSSSMVSTLYLSWSLMFLLIWLLSSFSDVHLFPTPKQVFNGFIYLWETGLIVHLTSSISLCLQAVFFSILISLILAYSTTIPFFKPNGNIISKLRYLPLTGIAYYVAIFIDGARTIQVFVLVIFMTTYLTTSLIQMISDIPEEEFFHAKTLGCNRWETLWEVVIKGRLDYVLELVRQNLAIVLMMLVTVESVLAAAGGIGFLIKNNDKLGDNGKVIAIQIVIILMGVLIDLGITKLRKLIFRFSNY